MTKDLTPEQIASLRERLGPMQVFDSHEELRAGRDQAWAAVRDEAEQESA